MIVEGGRPRGGARSPRCASPRRRPADGDPASDVLITQRVFFPYAGARWTRARTSSATRRRGGAEGLPGPGRADRARLRPRRRHVLWRKPQDYAKFLAQELATFNTDWVLIVMPNGYGIYRCVPKQRAGATRIRARAAADRGRRARARGAADRPRRAGRTRRRGPSAVRKLAALHGATIPEPGAAGRPIPIAGGVVLVAVGGAVTLLWLTRRATRR